jgi:phage baseplate assembly protein W
MTGYLTFPYQIDASGRTATNDLPSYVQSLVLLVLQTDPGERVNRPTFGAGLKSLVFLGMDGAFGSAAETLIRGKLMQFLSDIIAVQTLQVAVLEEEAKVSLTYTIIYTGETVSQVVSQGLPGAVTTGSRSATAGRAAAQVDDS